MPGKKSPFAERTEWEGLEKTSEIDNLPERMYKEVNVYSCLRCERYFVTVPWIRICPRCKRSASYERGLPSREG